MKPYNFDQILEIIKDQPKTLLIGNGFSQSVSEKFNYEKLLDLSKDSTLMNGQSLSNDVISIFDVLETDDFEKVMAYLNVTKKVLSAYQKAGNKNNNLQSTLLKIDDDFNNVKQVLISAISFTHKHLFQKTPNDMFDKIRLFLKRFNHIFTLNYDLILYWSILKCNDVNKIFYDGYWPSGWGTYENINKQQNIYYLHGALFLYAHGLHKITADSGNLVEKIIEKIKNENFSPLLVLEGKYIEKESMVKDNPYLFYCFNELGRKDSHLITIGTRLNEHSDEHIYEQIKKGKYKSISFGLYNYDENNSEHLKLKERMEDLKNSNRPVYFFDAATAINWNRVE